MALLTWTFTFYENEGDDEPRDPSNQIAKSRHPLLCCMPIREVDQKTLEGQGRRPTQGQDSYEARPGGIS